MKSTGSNKAKIAKRVIEVLEFFDQNHRQATVMDIVRRFDRPQSSTSELLSSMVELGLLYKDNATRSYAPTPRVALLGSDVQPPVVRDGRLTSLVDRLSAQTGLDVGIFGLVGLMCQIFSWRNGKCENQLSGLDVFSGGQKEYLSDCAAGHLLLSTIEMPRRQAVIRRLNAEARDGRKFNYTEMCDIIDNCAQTGYSTGHAGFNSSAHSVSVLLPGFSAEQPVAIGFIYQQNDRIDAHALLKTLQDSVARCVETQDDTKASVRPLFDNNIWKPKLEKIHG